MNKAQKKALVELLAALSSDEKSRLLADLAEVRANADAAAADHDAKLLRLLREQIATHDTSPLNTIL